VPETATLHVTKTTCSGCEQRTGTALRWIGGVCDVAADHTTGCRCVSICRRPALTRSLIASCWPGYTILGGGQVRQARQAVNNLLELQADTDSVVQAGFERDRPIARVAQVPVNGLVPARPSRVHVRPVSD
jgi:copper chaperone CopZ